MKKSQIQKVDHFLGAIALIAFIGCASVRTVHEDKDGGIVKYLRRGPRAAARNEEAISKIEEHCKAGGFTKQEIMKEYPDGRFQVIEYRCL